MNNTPSHSKLARIQENSSPSVAGFVVASPLEAGNAEQIRAAEPEGEVLSGKLARVLETCRRQAETILRLEHKVILAEQTVFAAEEAVAVERSLRTEFEQKSSKKSETIRELENLRAEMETELTNLREQLKLSSVDKSGLSLNFDKFTELAKSEIRGLKAKLEEFARNAHMVEMQRVQERLALEQHVAEIQMQLKVRQEEIFIYKRELGSIEIEKHVLKATALEEQLAKLFAERSEEKAALAALLEDNNGNLRSALAASEDERRKRFDAELRLDEIEKENNFLKHIQKTEQQISL